MSDFWQGYLCAFVVFSLSYYWIYRGKLRTLRDQHEYDTKYSGLRLASAQSRGDYYYSQLMFNFKMARVNQERVVAFEKMIEDYKKNAEIQKSVVSTLNEKLDRLRKKSSEMQSRYDKLKKKINVEIPF